MVSPTTTLESIAPIDLDEIYELSLVEIETLRRAAAHKRIPFDSDRRHYSGAELSRFGLVREGYTRDELRERGVLPAVVSSLDEATDDAIRRLPIGTPFASGAVEKYELPIDMLPLRVAKTIFPPNTTVRRHVHPLHSEAAPGGGLRIVCSGSIKYDGCTYRAGDWFFIPNGTPYEFVSNSGVETVVFYSYAFFGVEDGNRFSRPY